MIKIALYGKGGIGKSTTAANLSMALSEMGYRVMQVGCDPKADSTGALCGGQKITTVLDAIREKGDVTTHTCVAYVFTFNSKSDAEEVFEIAKDRITKSSRAKAKDSGKKQDYSYAIEYEQSGVSRTVMAAYLEDKSVIYLQGMSHKDETNEFAEYFCKKMKYVSPTELIED